MKVLHILILITSLLTFCGCSKKSEEQPKPKTTVEILSKTWRISRVTINGSADNTNNYSSYRITLSLNGSYTIASGNAPINIVANSSNTGTWSLTNNETAILFDRGTAFQVTIDLVSKTDTLFAVRFKANDKLASEYLIEFVPA